MNNPIDLEIIQWLDDLQRHDALILPERGAGYVISRTEIRTATIMDILEKPLSPCPDWLKTHLAQLNDSEEGKAHG